MYTIKQAVQRTGVPADTLRTWERRYDFPRPARTDSGYRLYDDPAIEALRRVRLLIEQGAAPRQAVERVRASLTPASGTGEDAPPPEEFIQRYLAGEWTGPEVERHLRAGLRSGRLADVADDWLMPLLTLIGDAWADGRLVVAHEHVIAALVMAHLGAAYETIDAPEDGPELLVGLGHGCHHAIGPLLFAVLARDRGVRVRYLGENLPTDAWIQTLRETRPAGIVTAAHRGEDVATVRALTLALRSLVPTLPVWIGGARQQEVGSDVRPLGHRFGDAVDVFMDEWAALPGTPQGCAGPGV